jgi:DNA-binding response OmpR family regulator
MSEMNGFQLCRKLKGMDNKLKICFLSAADLLYYHETDPDIIRELGKGCFVLKPVDNEYFLEKIEEILSQN